MASLVKSRNNIEVCYNNGEVSLRKTMKKNNIHSKDFHYGLRGSCPIESYLMNYLMLNDLQWLIKGDTMLKSIEEGAYNPCMCIGEHKEADRCLRELIDLIKKSKKTAH